MSIRALCNSCWNLLFLPTATNSYHILLVFCIPNSCIIVYSPNTTFKSHLIFAIVFITGWNLEKLTHGRNRAGSPRYQLVEEQGAYIASKLTSRLLFLILWIDYDLRRNTSIYSINANLKSVSNKHQRPLLQCLSQILLRHARLASCASAIISVNIAPVHCLYMFSVLHYAATKFCSRIFLRFCLFCRLHFFGPIALLTSLF